MDRLAPDIRLQIITDLDKGLNKFEIASKAAGTLIDRGANFKEAYDIARSYTNAVGTGDNNVIQL